MAQQNADRYRPGLSPETLCWQLNSRTELGGQSSWLVTEGMMVPQEVGALAERSWVVGMLAVP